MAVEKGIHELKILKILENVQKNLWYRQYYPEKEFCRGEKSDNPIKE